jgi:uncharacterized membrane protein
MCERTGGILMRDKLKSKVVWLTAIPLIANLIAMFIPGVAEEFTQIATTIVSLLALFGILNNPNDSEKF